MELEPSHLALGLVIPNQQHLQGAKDSEFLPAFWGGRGSRTRITGLDLKVESTLKIISATARTRGGTERELKSLQELVPSEGYRQPCWCPQVVQTAELVSRVVLRAERAGTPVRGTDSRAGTDTLWWYRQQSSYPEWY